MKRTKSRLANSFLGTLENGPRGPILRDDAGVSWRLGFIDESETEGLQGRVQIRGRVVDVDRIEVDYIEMQNDA